jgi:hypothetical protein
MVRRAYAGNVIEDQRAAAALCATGKMGSQESRLQWLSLIVAQLRLRW